MKTLIQGITHLIAPRVCRICGCTLGVDEEVMCVGCQMQMPYTSLHLKDFNIIHQRLGAGTKIDRAAAWFYYKRSNPYSRLLVDAKYGQLPSLARKLGEMCAEDLIKDDFFEGIDVIVPMPMYWMKLMRRGYNQAREICRGISQVTGVEVKEALRAVGSHGVQSRHKVQERYESISGTLKLRLPEAVENRNVLFVDDIITTGATASEALSTIAEGNPASLHVLCLGLTALT